MSIKGYIKRNLVQFKSDEHGAVAIETVMIAPFVIGALLLTTTLSLQTLQSQKMQAGAYAGVGFLEDTFASGDYSSLQKQEQEDGRRKDSEALEKTKLIIKDASGLPLKLEDITVEAYCACPAVNENESVGDNGEPTDPLLQVNSFYARSALATSGSKICPMKCKDSFDARVIAEIDMVYNTENLMGKPQTVTRRVVKRLR